MSPQRYRNRLRSSKKTMTHKNIEKLIVNHNRRLQKLREEQALRGLDTPPHILTEIEDIESALEELQMLLKENSGFDKESPRVLPELAENTKVSSKKSLEYLQILVMDDEDHQAEPLKTLLEDHGFHADKETNPHRVRTLVQQKNYDAIFVDINMPHFNIDGIDVLVDIKVFAPNSNIILITGKSGRGIPSRVAEGMRLGASDFIEREPSVSMQTYIDKVYKVTRQPPRHDQTALREEWAQYLWDRMQRHQENLLKGQDLEGLIKLIFESVEDFENVETNISIDPNEEIDIEFENHRHDPFWKDHGGLIRVKCRSWSGRLVGTEEYYGFRAELKRIQLGFLVSYSGFSDNLQQAHLTTASGEKLIVLIDRPDLESLIKAKDRETLLRSLVRKAIRGYGVSTPSGGFHKKSQKTKDADRPKTSAGVDQTLIYQLKKQSWYAPEFPQTDEVAETTLGALKDEMDVVIITATNVELKAVLRLLTPLPQRKRALLVYAGPETYYLGKFGAHNAVVTKCRMGAIDSGGVILATEQAQRLWRPKAIIMTGIAFGKALDKQKMADVLIASQIISYEQQRVGEKEIVYRGSIPPSNTTLLNRFENVQNWKFIRPDGQACAIHIGPILSGEKLIDNPKFKATLFKHFPQAIGGEMEGAGLVAASGRVGTAWILVKSICDWGDGKKHKQHQPLAAAAAVSLVHHVLKQETILNAIKKPDRTV